MRMYARVLAAAATAIVAPTDPPPKHKPTKRTYSESSARCRSKAPRSASSCTPRMIPSRPRAMLCSVASCKNRRETGMAGKSPVGLGGEPGKWAAFCMCGCGMGGFKNVVCLSVCPIHRLGFGRSPSNARPVPNPNPTT